MRILSYYVIYENDTSEPPVGMLVEYMWHDAERRHRYHALYWNASAKQWTYDPTPGR
jgi:hypothetical protein